MEAEDSVTGYHFYLAHASGSFSIFNMGYFVIRKGDALMDYSVIDGIYRVLIFQAVWALAATGAIVYLFILQGKKGKD